MRAQSDEGRSGIVGNSFVVSLLVAKEEMPTPTKGLVVLATDSRSFAQDRGTKWNAARYSPPRRNHDSTARFSTGNPKRIQHPARALAFQCPARFGTRIPRRNPQAWRTTPRTASPSRCRADAIAGSRPPVASRSTRVPPGPAIRLSRHCRQARRNRGNWLGIEERQSGSYVTKEKVSRRLMTCQCPSSPHSVATALGLVRGLWQADGQWPLRVSQSTGP